MDREDDETRSSGLDELSRLFAPPPEDPPREREPEDREAEDAASEPLAPEPLGVARPGAGQPAVGEPAPFVPPPVAAVPMSHRSSDLASPETGQEPTGPHADRAPLFSPPPLVPVARPETPTASQPVAGAAPPGGASSDAPLFGGTGASASRSEIAGAEAPAFSGTAPAAAAASASDPSRPSRPAAAASPTPPAAPAFGGLPIAPRTAPSPVSPAPTIAAPTERPRSLFAPETVRPAPDPAASPPPAASSGSPAAPAAFAEAPPAPVSGDAARRVAPPAVPEQSAPTPSPAVPGAPPRSGLSVPLLPGGSRADEVDEEQFARSTVVEKILFVLAFLLPPIGLIGSIVAAVRSSRRRGWVIGLLQASIAVGVVFSVIAAGGAYAGYKVLRQQQAHAQTAEASTAFCAAFAKDPTLGGADGGWPQPAASVPDSMTAMQGFVDRWTALAKVSPAGIQQGVQSIAATGTEVINSVKVQRTVDDAQNRQLVQSAVGASGVAAWRSDYCD